MNVLSIDWDYFFPDTQQFDWSMNEDNFLYYEMLWPIRWSNSAIFNNEVKAATVMHPNGYHLRFWDEMETRLQKLGLIICITESHKDLYNIVKQIGIPVKIWNFDQHHDCGYGSREHEFNCGNWAQHLKRDGLMKEFHQVYPAWRKENEEPTELPKWATVQYDDDALALPKKFNLVFICRSSPWTPSWSDQSWMGFINWFKVNRKADWKRKLAVEYAMKTREFDHKAAEQFKQESDNIMKKGVSHAMLSN